MNGKNHHIGLYLLFKTILKYQIGQKTKFTIRFLQIDSTKIKSKYQAGNIVIGQKCLIGEKMKLEIIITMISLVETSKELKKN